MQEDEQKLESVFRELTKSAPAKSQKANSK